jgi:hypothetical protein
VTRSRQQDIPSAAQVHAWMFWGGSMGLEQRANCPTGDLLKLGGRVVNEHPGRPDWGSHRPNMAP